MSTNYSPSNLKKYLAKGFVSEKHKDADLYIYGYNSNFHIVWDETNINLRGLITDNHGNIVGRSFQKFFNFKAYLSDTKFLLSDNQIADIPKGKFKVLEKIDGCLVMLYWINDKPYLATQRSFSSKKAIKATQILYNKYAYTFDRFDRNKTYIFEAVFPETNVIIDYGDIEDLFLIGILDTQTGNDSPLENIGFKLPIDYTADFNLVTDIKVLQQMNMPNKEGFILVYDNGYRLKVKFPWYNTTHSLFAKIKRLQEELYFETKKLKVLKDIPQNTISNTHIYAALNENKSIESIYRNIPHSHFLRGIEHWLEDVHKEYDAKKKRLEYTYSAEEINNYLVPDEEAVFDIYRLAEKYQDSIMWNFMNRIKETYD